MQNFFKKMYVVELGGECLLGIKVWFDQQSVFYNFANIAERSK